MNIEALKNKKFDLCSRNTHLLDLIGKKVDISCRTSQYGMCEITSIDNTEEVDIVNVGLKILEVSQEGPFTLPCGVGDVVYMEAQTQYVRSDNPWYWNDVAIGGKLPELTLPIEFELDKDEWVRGWNWACEYLPLGIEWYSENGYDRGAPQKPDHDLDDPLYLKWLNFNDGAKKCRWTRWEAYYSGGEEPLPI